MAREDIERRKTLWHFEEFASDSRRGSGLAPTAYAEFMPTVLEIVLARRERDPLLVYERVADEMGKRWTASKWLPVHGGWHHAVVPSVLVASLRNCGHPFGDADVKEAFERGSMMPGFICGFHGTCGSGVGVGIAVSIASRSTPLHGDERSNALEATGQALTRIAALNGPRCCPLSAYTSLDLGARVLGEMGYPLERSAATGRCRSFSYNAECQGVQCPYHPASPKRLTGP